MTRPGILTRVAQKVSERQRRTRFEASVRHVHGPQTLDAAPGEVVLIALVRDGSYYLDAFFDHYRAMGIRHFVFFDNGSTDDTLEQIKAQDGTIIDQSLLPLSAHEDLFRQFPARTYGQERWCLYVDMDEVFDFEGRAEIGIGGLIGYLEHQGATALAAQMLEMFPKAPLAEVAELPFNKALVQFCYYDVSTVERFPYFSESIEYWRLLKDNTLMDERVAFYFGGVRGKVFGENCCLTKHPLVFNGGHVTPAPHPHLSTGVRVADVTGLIKHYKFTNNALARDAASQQGGVVRHGEDKARLRVLEGQPSVSLWSEMSKEWDGIAPLYDAGFLVRSARYDAFLREKTL